MDRRTVISGLVTAAGGLGGCTNGDLAPSGGSSRGTGCPPQAMISVSATGTTQATATVLDAEADDLTANPYLAEALAAASDAFEQLSQTGAPGGTLARVRGTDVYNSDANVRLAGQETYVAYEGTTYLVHYSELHC